MTNYLFHFFWPRGAFTAGSTGRDVNAAAVELGLEPLDPGVVHPGGDLVGRPAYVESPVAPHGHGRRDSGQYGRVLEKGCGLDCGEGGGPGFN